MNPRPRPEGTPAPRGATTAPGALIAAGRRWAHRPLPTPSPRWRRGPWRATAFTSALRTPALTARLGLVLAGCFGVCLLTGLYSHLVQHPPGWLDLPSRPVRFYQVSQGVHVATGLATIPLLGVKLWAVYPGLFHWPPVRNLAHLVERLSVAALVSAALFEVVTGVFNIAAWYAPMPFFFPSAHYWVAWLATGAIVTHVGVKLPVIRAALRRAPAPPTPDRSDRRDPIPPTGAGWGRRGLLGAVAASVGLVTVTTVGQSLPPLAGLAVLTRRRPGTGPQGVPVNRSARAAGVVALAADSAYRLEVAGPAGTVRLSLPELAALPQHTARLPIACVEGWSADAVWTGVRLRDLAALVGADPDRSAARVESLQPAGRYRASELGRDHLRDPLTLLALRVGGQVLHPDHGFPCRLIAPNRPGVLQTKWVARVIVRVAR